MRQVTTLGVLLTVTFACEPPATNQVDVPVDLPDTVTFAAHIAPILYENCVACHRVGGHAPFSLTSYENAQLQGPAMVAATAAGRMPPWLPKRGEHRFDGERFLTPWQIGAIRKWVESGAPVGDSTAAPELPTFVHGWQLGEPDMVLEMPEAFTLYASGPDRFRNFVIPVDLDRPRYVRAVDLDPGEGYVVHHAMIMVDDTRSSKRRDRQDPEPGFDGMFAGSAARPPSGSFLGWTPGKVPNQGTPGLAWKLEPGMDIVLQLHLQPRGGEQEVRAAVGLYFTDEPPTRVSFWLTLGSRKVDLPAGKRGIEVFDSYVLPVDAQLFGMYPHAHYLGDEIESTAILPGGETIPLIDIPRWNFNQQDFYRYVDPVPLPRGTELTMRISFDNSDENPLNPNKPPRRVTYGPASGDEMANLFVQLVVRDSTDLQTLEQDFGRKYQYDLEEGMRFLLDVFPDNVSYMAELGHARQERGELAEAKRWYQRALEVDPTYQPARYNLATAVEAEGDLAGAKQLYSSVIRAEPDNVPALYNLAALLQADGDFSEAMLTYLDVIALEPTHARAHNNLGNALVEARRPSDALPYYLKALTLDPNQADAHNNLANLYSSLGQPDSALAHFRQAVQIDPLHSLAHFNYGRALVERGEVADGIAEMRASVSIQPDWYIGWATLAWTLATSADASLRNPRQAIEYARRAAELSDNVHPVVLDALAAAYAADGQYRRAVDTAERAIQIAHSAGQMGLVDRIESRLAYYQRGEPYAVP